LFSRDDIICKLTPLKQFVRNKTHSNSELSTVPVTQGNRRVLVQNREINEALLLRLCVSATVA